ncbi:MAG TPA: enoyl-CoA hydratase-related protein, partial [Beijerinckiaceae bacterium]|nr:enoyl-CoA hydratase-related protein [Beijerinckiaceae bacterium]
ALRALVIASSGNEAFCAGGDLQQMGDGAPDAFDAHGERGQFAALFRDLWDLGKPVLARVQGPAMAGGFGLAAACDLIIASEKASFGLPEVAVGIWPYMITVPLLHAMAPRQALRLMMTGERIDAVEGQRLGFVTEVTPHAELDACIDRWIARLSAGSPQAIALGRTAFYTALNHDMDARLRMLEALLTANLTMPDAAEGLAAFAEKRRPNWKT